MMAIKTLLVDDERSSLEEAEIFLEKINDEIEVSAVSSVEKALDLLDEKDFDVIVSDYQMPDRDGLDFLEEIREERDWDIPFIIFTGKGREEVAIKALNLGADRYLQKGGDPKSQYKVLVDAIVKEYNKWKSKRRLEKSEEEKSRILEITSDEIAYHDLEHRIIWANQSYLESLGKSLDKVNGKKCYNVWYGRDEHCEGCPIERAMKSGEREKGEISPPETDRHWLITATPDIDEEGNIIGVIESSLDIKERKKIQDELEKSKERYKALFEGNPEALVETDEDFRILRVNVKFESLFGFKEEEIKGKPLNELIVPKDKLKEAEKLNDESKNEGYFDHETVRLNKDGEEIAVSITGRPIDENEKTHYLAVYRDISDRKKAEEELKEREEKYRTIFEAANDAIFIMKKDRFVDCNEKTLEIFDCDREDIVGAPPFEFSPEKQPDGRDSREMALEKINSAFEGEPQEFEWVHKTKSGEAFHAEVTLNRYMIDGERFVMAIVRDITDRKEAKKQIEENKNKIERLHEISAELQTCQSEEEVYSFAVEAAEDILDFDICGFDAVEGDKFVVKGISSDTPKGGSTERRIDEGGLDRKTYLNQESYLVNDLYADKDAKPVKSEYRSAISVPVGEQGVFQAVSKKTDHFDEEDLKMAELLSSHVSEALNRIKVKKRENFLHSLLRHDVGNKAQIARGYLDLMEKNSDSQTELEEYREKAKQAIIAAQRMIEKVRKLRKIDEEEEIGNRDLSLVIDKILSEHLSEINEREINTDIKVSDRVVKGGPLLEELFSNLIENSLRHSRCDMIRINSEIEDDECVVTLEDDGIGISDEDKDKIFDKGYKKGETAGTGLGLYMVKEIANNYDGDVEVKDSDLGGVKFEVRLKRI